MIRVFFHIRLILPLALLICGVPTLAFANNTRADADDFDLNSTISYSLDPAGDVDWLRILVPESGELAVWTTGSTDTVGTLTDANGNVLVTSEDIDANNFAFYYVADPGTYYIKVEGWQDPESGKFATGDYDLYSAFRPDGILPRSPDPDDSNGWWEFADDFALYDTLDTYSIRPIDDVDWLRIEVPSAGVLEVWTTGNTDTYGLLVDSDQNGLLTGSDQNILAEDDDAGTGLNFHIQADVSAGVHYVAIQGYDTGSYSIHSDFTEMTVSPADVNNDGVVDVDDLVLVATHFGTTNAQADVNNDGIVDFKDILLVLVELEAAAVDDILSRTPADFVSASPTPGSSIAQNTSITVTFDNDPGELTADAFTVTGSGKSRTIEGPFPVGGMNLTVTWADGWHHLAYIVIAPDTDPPEITVGTVSDGDEDVDSEYLNADGVIEIAFNEPVSGNIALQTEDGDDVGWIGSVDGRTATLELVPGKELDYRRTTYVIVGKVSDPAGNETEIEIIFTTSAVPFHAVKSITALWSFDEGGGNMVRDLSSNGFDGSIEGGARWVSGKFGRALQFAGQGQGVVIENIPFNFFNSEEGMTVTGWFYPNDAVTNRPHIEKDGSFYIGFNHAGFLEFVIQPDDTTFFAEFPFNNELRRWHHFAVTFDRNGTTFYINGVRNTWSGRENNVPIAPSEADLVIGAGFVGIIDEIALYNKALTEEAIIEMMNNWTGIFGEE